MAGRERLVTGSFLLVSLSSFGYFLALGATLPTLPLYISGPLRGGSVAVGIVIGIFSVTAIVMRPIAGRLGDRRGRKLLVASGTGIIAVALLLMPLSEAMTRSSKIGALAFVVAVRLAMGVGEAFLFTGAVTMIGDLAPPGRQSEAVSFFTLSLYGGLGIGAIIGEAVMTNLGYSSLWLVAAALAGAGFLLALPLGETRPDGAGDQPGRLVHRAAIAPGSIMAMSVWAYAGFNAFLPLYIGGLHAKAGPVFVVYSFVVVAVRLFGARLPDRYGPTIAATTSLIGTAVGLVIVALVRSLPGLYAGTVILALGQSLAFPALLGMAMRGAPASERGSVVGTFTAFVDIGFGLGPVASGGIAVVFGYRGVFISLAAVAILGLIVLAVRQNRALRQAVAQVEGSG